MPKQIKRLYIGDNLPIMLGMESDSVDLIYTDPPFNTGTFRKGKTEKHSFIDTWSEYQVDFAYAYSLKMHHPKLWEMIALAEDMHSLAMRHYLEFMAPRIVQMHRLLKPTGSLYLHCDTNANYYLRILIDCVFGKNNFRNEIVWHHPKIGVGKNKFTSNTDTIYFYSKTENYRFVAQRGDRPNELYTRWQSKLKEGVLYYAQAKLINDSPAKSKIRVREGELGRKLRDNDVVVDFNDPENQKVVDNVWKIPFLKGNSKESTGYNSQKPLALVDRVIRASSNEGDLVMDPFCGCATTCVAAAGLSRQWIGVDQNKDAIPIFRDRLTGDLTTYAFETNSPADAKLQKPIALPQRQVTGYARMTKAKAKPILVALDLKQYNYTFCKGCLDRLHEKHLAVDHILAKDKGGLDELANYQLLCTNCNSKKGTRDMEFLYRKLDEERAQMRMKIKADRQSKVPKK